MHDAEGISKGSKKFWMTMTTQVRCDVNILAAQTTSSRSRFEETKGNGVSFSGSSISYGSLLWRFLDRPCKQKLNFAANSC